MDPKTFKKISDYQWEIPQEGEMLVPGRIFADGKLIEEMDEKVREQVTNVACLPGILKSSLAMPDAHWGYGFCAKKGTKVLTSLGFYKKIEDFQKNWENQSLKIIGFASQEVTDTPILKFLKLKSKELLKLTTKTRREIFVTPDHPFYTPKGMYPLEKLKAGDKIAVFPFEGVPYKKPSKKIIASERNIKRTLLKLRRKPGEVGFEQNILALRKRNLLPLTYDHPKLPYILKIIGFVFGDGSMNFIGRKGDGIIHFSGKKGDLEEIRKDVKKIGYTPSPIHIQNGKIFYKGKERNYINYFFNINASSLLILLKTLGMPLGKKAFQHYRVPKWIFKCPLWQKRLFLTALFGAGLRKAHPRKTKKTMFHCPVLSMNKTENLIFSGEAFLKDISKLLKGFGVETIYIDQRKKHVNTKKEITWELDLIFSSKTESLINLWSKIGFEYNKKRNFQANIAAQYLKYKQKILKEKQEAINMTIPELLKQGLSYRKVSLRLATSNPLTKRFIQDICWKINKGIKDISPQVSRSFPGFSEYLKEVTQGLGESGMVWDEIIEIKKVPYRGFVYDFTVAHPDHNFIANNFVVSNCIGGVAAMDKDKGVISVGGVGFDSGCGVRTLKTDLTLNEVKPKIRGLVDLLFQTVPSGMGSRGKIILSPKEAEELFREGAEWVIKKGYGTEDDLRHIEDGGSLEGAEPEYVSETAKRREKGQVGTLGSGNHYLEIQYIDKIYDKETAKNFGLFKNQILISIHCGSRALGHQIGTDYLKVLAEASRKYGIRIRDRELVCAPINSFEGQKYAAANLCALNYSYANRQVIAYLAREGFKKNFPKAEVKTFWDLTHNSARWEKHEIGGELKKVLVHRKGSTRSFGPNRKEIPEEYRRIGQPVIIGGTMGTYSFILRGTDFGMKAAFGSACHGAGRAMSRTKAKKKWWGSDLAKELEKQGIYSRTASWGGFAEEAPGAYKDVAEVIEAVHNANLAKKVVRMRPLGVMKG